MKSCWVGFGAFLGANMRYWIGEWVGARGPGSFPWATFAINVVGSMAIGAYFAWELRHQPSSAYRLFFVVGVCGGFTTFSAFSWEAFKLLERGEFVTLGLYAAGSMILTVAACAAGFGLTRSLLGG